MSEKIKFQQQPMVKQSDQRPVRLDTETKLALMVALQYQPGDDLDKTIETCLEILKRTSIATRNLKDQFPPRRSNA